MQRNRNKKILIIIALMVSFVCLSVGFAAFSTTLNISSSAIVNPSSDSFSIEVIGADENGDLNSTVSSVGDGEGAIAGVAKINNGKNISITDITADFSAPGQRVIYGFVIKNTGKYTAHLKTGTVKLYDGVDDSIVCTPSANSDVTEELMDAACQAIDVQSMIMEENDNPDLLNLSLRQIFSAAGTNTVPAGNTISIEPGGMIVLTLFIVYDQNGARADGPFDVKIADYMMEFSTLSN